MDVKEAVAKARNYLATAFSGENISEVRLEEVEFDRSEDAWRITLGIMRPSTTGRSGLFASNSITAPLQRTYKVVSVPNNESQIPSIKIREFADE